MTDKEKALEFFKKDIYKTENMSHNKHVPNVWYVYFVHQNSQEELIT